MSARENTLLVPVGRLAVCLLVIGLQSPVRAQGAQQASPSSSGLATSNRSVPGGERYALARVFYSPIQRHELDVAEADALSRSDATNASPAPVRFNGWLSGPGPTRTWINGTAHVAGDRAAATTAGTPGAGPSAQREKQMSLRREDSAGPLLPSAGATARFDPGSEQLVIVKERGREVRLRAGQSEDQDAFLPLATPREPPRPQASSDSVPVPLADPPLIGGPR